LKRPDSLVNSSVSKEESERTRRWSGGSNGSTISAKNKSLCYNCGGLDHFMRDCRADIKGAKSPTLANKSVNAIADISEIEFVGFTAQNISAPYIQVRILDKVYNALLDTGSPCSFIDDNILKDIIGLDEKAVACVRKFRFLKGEYTCLKVISLEVDYLMGKIPLDLYFVPDRGKTIILGRDFLFATDINIYIGVNGWTHKDDSKLNHFLDRGIVHKEIEKSPDSDSSEEINLDYLAIHLFDENRVFAAFEDFDLQLFYDDYQPEV